MSTTLTIVSMDQGKIYRDWTLETVDDAQQPAKASLIVRFAGLLPGAMMWLAVSLPLFKRHIV